MTPIVIGNRNIYRADEGKKVKFVGDDRLYSEISVPLNDDREVEEVENGNS